jgi:hypothetical protein
MPLKDKLAAPGRPQPAPLEYAGQWVAWNKDETQIIAHGTDVAEVRAAAIAAGEDDPILEKVRRPDRMYIVGQMRVPGEHHFRQSPGGGGII